MKLEIGGGTRNLGGDWINVDVCPTANVCHDLNILPWPFPDESADALYASHCFEHLNFRGTGAIAFKEIAREIARICKIGASVEIRQPDAFAEMAMCPGHNAVISIDVVRHCDSVFPREHWHGSPRRLKLTRIEPGCDDYWFPQARSNPLFSAWSDIDILTWLPRTRHENRFHFVVVANEFA